jgi:hypothetical protein
VRHVSNTNRYHRPPEESEAEFTRFLLDELEQAIVAMGPETVCLVHMEPVQNAGGCFTPPEGYWRGVREICDRYDILLSADEVITPSAASATGSAPAVDRPDIVTMAKGSPRMRRSASRGDRQGDGAFLGGLDVSHGYLRGHRHDGDCARTSRSEARADQRART